MGDLIFFLIQIFPKFSTVHSLLLTLEYFPPVVKIKLLFLKVHTVYLYGQVSEKQDYWQQHRAAIHPDTCMEDD